MMVRNGVSFSSYFCRDSSEMLGALPTEIRKTCFARLFDDIFGIEEICLGKTTTIIDALSKTVFSSFSILLFLLIFDKPTYSGQSLKLCHFRFCQCNTFGKTQSNSFVDSHQKMIQFNIHSLLPPGAN